MKHTRHAYEVMMNTPQSPLQMSKAPSRQSLLGIQTGGAYNDGQAFQFIPPGYNTLDQAKHQRKQSQAPDLTGVHSRHKEKV